MSELQAPVGVLLLNLGTPQGPDKRSVRAYLREFLMDPRVIDIPALARYVLLYGLILPLRLKTSVSAYQQIWTHSGSPLLHHSQQLTQALAVALGDRYVVELGMRYGAPSIATALERLRGTGCQKLLVLPLFPQYSSAATGSALEKTLVEIKKNLDIPEVHWINEFSEDPGFINAWRACILEHQPAEEPEMWIFSFHGLPVRHLDKRGCDTQNCLARIECEKPNKRNYLCYRRQCFATAARLADVLNLPPERYRVAFQSRLGRTPWITPYTDYLLPDLAKQGIKRIAVICPSFVADCLETLEEIGIRARAQWQNLGGEGFTLIPCLNNHPLWVDALKKILLSMHAPKI